jgi:predicted transcriptional regulator
MVLHLTPEQEAVLQRAASQVGKPVEELLAEAAVSLLREKESFLSAVDRGLAAAARGEFIEEEEMDARVEKMLRS